MNNTLKQAVVLPKESYVSPYLRQPVRQLEEAIAAVGRAPRGGTAPQSSPAPRTAAPADET